MIIRKFYDAAVAEPVGEVAVEPVAEKMQSMAEKMATAGIIKTGDETETTVIPEKKEETKEPKEVTPAATATESKEVVETKTESPAKVEPEKVETPKKSESAPPAKQWQEVLKEQPDAVLKELGFNEQLVGFINGLKEIDPKMVAFLDHWKNNNGDVSEYLKELTTDYSKMSAEDVMFHQLRQEYPKASEAALTALYKKEIIKQYNLDSDDDDERAEGQLLLEAKAEKYRDLLTEKQQGFLLPKPTPPKEKEADPAEVANKAEGERIVKEVNDNPYTQSVRANKFITVGDGEEKFNFPVDPEAVIDLVLYGDKTGELTFNIERNEDGSVKTATPRPRQE